MKIKVCGMKEPENIRQLSSLNPDYMGFIFYPNSKRFTAELDTDILTNLPISIKKTGVFVNEELFVIADKIKKYQLDAVQLHGDETPEICRELSENEVEIIKAFGIDDNFNFSNLEPYLNVVDYFLFDTKTTAHGGSGKSFNWQLLKNYIYQKPYFLSGGLSLENLDQVMNFKDNRFYAVDLNSCFELEPGIKNIQKLKEAILIINQ